MADPLLGEPRLPASAEGVPLALDKPFLNVMSVQEAFHTTFLPLFSGFSLFPAAVSYPIQHFS